MSLNAATGLSGMLKEGTRYFSSEGDAMNASVTLRNIEACLELGKMLSTSLGPQGRAKLVVNHLGRLNVTSDCASILKEIEIEHPAAQLLKQACQKQETECGDNTNFVVALAGELLWQTALLIQKMTWQNAPELLMGYQRSLQLLTEEYLPNLVVKDEELQLTDLTQKSQLVKLLLPILASKQYGTEDILAPLVADACLQVMTRSPTDGKKLEFHADAVRIVKILGSSVQHSSIILGFVAQRGVETTLTQVTNGAKIAVYASGIEASSTEAKGTVLMKTAEDLKAYNKTEESKMQEIIDGIAASGVNVVVTGGNVSDMALHFLNRNKLLCVKLGSKWELRRLCQAVNATALVRLGAPTPDEMGHCDSVMTKQVGGRLVTVFSHANADAAKGTKLATILLRASTLSVLNDLERAVDDGVQAVAQAVTNSNSKQGCQLVYGGGAVEMACSVLLMREAGKVPGLEQYSMEAFAKALQVIPRTLAENAGWDTTRVLADLQAAHATSQNEALASGKAIAVCDSGIDIERDDSDDFSKKSGGVTSMKDKGVVDLLSTKVSALKLAVDATITILKIDQIIMSKQSGGPKV